MAPGPEPWPPPRKHAFRSTPFSSHRVVWPTARGVCTSPTPRSTHRRGVGSSTPSPSCGAVSTQVLPPAPRTATPNVWPPVAAEAAIPETPSRGPFRRARGQLNTHSNRASSDAESSPCSTGRSFSKALSTPVGHRLHCPSEHPVHQAGVVPDPGGVAMSGHRAVHIQSRRRYPTITHHRHPSGLPSGKALGRKPWVGCEFLCTEVVTPPHAVRTICTYNMRTSPGRSTRGPANGHSCTTNRNPWCPSTAG